MKAPVLYFVTFLRHTLTGFADCFSDPRHVDPILDANPIPAGKPRERACCLATEGKCGRLARRPEPMASSVPWLRLF